MVLLEFNCALTAFYVIVYVMNITILNDYTNNAHCLSVPVTPMVPRAID